ncbi:hypothetical protein [Catenulispora pinisilvae]|uniref:hypothetical protein n=1 Tax=Catenulispora pinisilvae TaxID=2705253 RepID=UPI00189259D6|nr:hypothetical protein [Catenulispora pinisilvae]
MSESQFTYSRMTLDELRSLAASPQVGTIQAMPQSFRSLAERVGDVADLLAHAQTDMPNWWRGPAAEQAAATLGRAAAEAREFHDSAMGAATAVGRCAQIVAEQQHQMMNVPELPEPGITDVVRRPTTPFEALEAARQDAAYQAAHEQAVQVVNGIAAQYVETRSQLSNIGTFRAENFTPTPTTLPPIANTDEGFDGDAHSTRLKEVGNIQLGESQQRAGAASFSIRRASIKGQPLASPRTPRYTSSKFEKSTTTAQALSHTSQEAENGRPAKGAAKDFPDQSLTPTPLTKTDTTTGDTTGGTPSISEDAEPKGHSPNNKHADTLSRATAEQEPASDVITDRLGFGHPRRSPFTAAKTANPPVHSEPQPTDIFDASHDNTQDSTASQPSSNAPAYQPDSSSSEYAGMTPPYSGVGPVHRTREERSPRPAYLKERKSAWLPDTVAVPADGVITPEWLEHH